MNDRIKEPRILKFSIKDINIEIRLKYRVGLLVGDSGKGKTYVYNLVDDYRRMNKSKDIICFNNLDIASDDDYVDFMVNKIRKSNNTLILIDQADEVLETGRIKKIIDDDTDSDNFYVLIGRNCKEYSSYIMSLNIVNNSIKIEALDVI